MPRCIPAFAFGLLVFFGGALPSLAQPPAVQERTWSGTASAGLSLTSGNTDNSLFNVAFDVVLSPKGRHVIKSDALLIRGENDHELSSNHLTFNVRDQVQVSPRAFLFAQHQYLRDPFKEIDYFLAPTSGVGYKTIDSPRTQMSLDGGIGLVGEKRPTSSFNPWLCLTAGERVVHALTGTASVSQSFTGIWKTRDLGNALYTFGAGLSTAISAHTELKLEVIDTFRNTQSSAAVQRNDVALIAAFAYKM